MSFIPLQGRFYQPNPIRVPQGRFARSQSLQQLPGQMQLISQAPQFINQPRQPFQVQQVLVGPQQVQFTSPPHISQNNIFPMQRQHRPINTQNSFHIQQQNPVQVRRGSLIQRQGLPPTNILRSYQYNNQPQVLVQSTNGFQNVQNKNSKIENKQIKRNLIKKNQTNNFQNDYSQQENKTNIPQKQVEYQPISKQTERANITYNNQYHKQNNDTSNYNYNSQSQNQNYDKQATIYNYKQNSNQNDNGVQRDNDYIPIPDKFKYLERQNNYASDSNYTENNNHTKDQSNLRNTTTDTTKNRSDLLFQSNNFELLNNNNKKQSNIYNDEIPVPPKYQAYINSIRDDRYSSSNNQAAQQAKPMFLDENQIAEPPLQTNSSKIIERHIGIKQPSYPNY